MHLLCGRAKKSEEQRQLEVKNEIRKLSGGSLGKVFSTVIEPERIQEAGGRRRRVFDTWTTFWAFLGQVLRGGSLRDGLLEVQASRAKNGKEAVSVSTGAYARARQRLCMNVLEQIHERVVGKVMQLSRGHQRRVWVVDGSSVQLPDTAANQKSYPQAAGQKAGCGFPVMQIVGLFDLNTGVMAASAQSTWREHESGLLQDGLMEQVQSGDVLMADRGFCSYLNFAQAIGNGADVLMRLHQTRPWPKGAGADSMVQWKRPLKSSRPRFISAQQWGQLPERLTVRYLRIRIEQPGYRTREIRLATTLMDASAEELTALYLRRWEMEVSLRDLKTTLGMELLRCKTPDMVAKELLMHLIAHNLIRWLILKASRSGNVTPDRLSFKGALDALIQYAAVLPAEGSRKQHNAIERMLENIASDLLPFRPFRREPRCLKRRPKGYQYLTRHRHLMTESPSHRNK